MTSRQATDERISFVCRHLAVAAVDGATDELAGMLGEQFVLHLDGATTSTSGYLALIEASHAAHASCPPLDVVDAAVAGDIVTVLLDAACLARLKVRACSIVEMWLIWDDRLWESVRRRMAT